MGSTASNTTNLDTAEPILLNSLVDNILRLTLNRPRFGNCLSLALMKTLTEGITAAGNNSAVKVIIISANGPLFCSGHDLKEMTGRRNDADKGREFFEETFGVCQIMLKAIRDCSQPVIAEIQGPALAAGAQLVATCDLAIASENAQFCLPGVNIGLFCSTPMVAVSRNVSHKHTMEMLLTGEMISAQHACEIGLINRAVPPADLPFETQKLAGKIATKSQTSIHIGKHAFYEQSQMSLDDAYEYTSRVMVENMLIASAKEGIGAFLEKREPEWPDEGSEN